MVSQSLLAYDGLMPSPGFPRLDRTALWVGDLSSQSDEKAYALSKDHRARLQAVELSRQAVYGYDPCASRIRRLLEIAQLTRS
jgi:hypothetical protein